LPVFKSFVEVVAKMIIGLTEPTTTIVVHVSGSPPPYRNEGLSAVLRRADSAAVTGSGRVLFNQARIKTEWNTGTVLLAHLSNFVLADRWAGNFSHFVLLAENSFLVRPGFEVGAP
jgi:hypothetical protein